jgi:hypothetical protein
MHWKVQYRSVMRRMSSACNDTAHDALNADMLTERYARRSASTVEYPPQGYQGCHLLHASRLLQDLRDSGRRPSEGSTYGSAPTVNDPTLVRLVWHYAPGLEAGRTGPVAPLVRQTTRRRRRSTERPCNLRGRWYQIQSLPDEHDNKIGQTRSIFIQ